MLFLTVSLRKSWIWLRRLVVLAVLGLWATGCAAPVPFDGVELTLWQGIGPPENRQVFQSLVQQFNDTHPGIQVNSRYVGQPDQQIPKILTAVVGNVAPDLLWYVPTLTGQLVELNALQPLDDWWRQSPYAQDLDPALLGTMQFEEHLWSVPFATNNAALFYRPSLFQAAGIAPLPHTWADLREAALRLTQDTNGDGRPDQHGLLLSFGKGEWTVFCWLPLVYSAGGHLAEAGQPDLANGGAIAALDYAQTLLPYARLSAPEQGYDITPLLKGQVAMQVTGPWVLPELDAAGIDYGVLPFPAWDVAHPPTAVLGGENLFFLRGPGKAADPSEATGQSLTKTQAAYQFLDYILSPDFQLPWAIQTGYLPATQSVRQQPTYQAFLAQHPELQIFLNQMTQAKARPVLPKYNQLSQSFGYALEATLLGQSAPAALTEAQQKMEKTNIPNHHRKNQPLHGQ